MRELTIKLPDEIIKKLQKIAKEEEKTKPELIREIIQKEIKTRNTDSLEDLIGLLTEEEAEEIKTNIKNKNKETTNEIKNRTNQK